MKCSNVNKRKPETMSVGEEAAAKLFLRKDRQKEAASIIDGIISQRGLVAASVASAGPGVNSETGVRPNEVVVQDGRVMSIPPHIAVTMRTCVQHTDRERNEAFGFDNGKDCPVCAMRAASNLHAQQTPTDSVREPKSVLVEKTKEEEKKDLV